MGRVLEEVEEAYENVRSKYEEAVKPLLKHDAQIYRFYYNYIVNKKVDYSGDLDITYTSKDKEITHIFHFRGSNHLITKPALENEIDIIGEEYEEKSIKIPEELGELKQAVDNYINTIDYLSREIDLDDLKSVYKSDYTDNEKQAITSIALKRIYDVDLDSEETNLLEELNDFSDIQIIGTDSYILVRTGENISYVLGEDKSQEPSIFVHSVDDRHFSIREVRDKSIRNAMGFGNTTKNLNVYPHDIEVHRIQGDLYFKRYTDSKNMYDSVKYAHMIDEILETSSIDIYWDLFRVTFTGGKRDKNYRNYLDLRPIRNRTIEAEIQGISGVRRERMRTNRGFEDRINWERAIRSIKSEMYENIDKKLYHTQEPMVAERVPPEMEMTDKGIPKMGEQSVEYRPARGEEILDIVYDDEPEMMYLPIDNHLIIIEGAYLYPLEDDREEEPVRIVIPEETNIQIWHEEHENISTEIPKGVFEFGLLDRGEKVWEYNVRT